MGRALDVELRVIPSRIANPFIRDHHYSGKVVQNSSLHFGAFIDRHLHGVMSFGPPLDKSKVLGLVEGTPWNGMLELNRMAFDDALPRNSESHAISLAIKLLRRNAPHVKWVLSFADATQCGDGTIYRAANFLLTGIRPNHNVARLPDGREVHKMTIESSPTMPRPELGGASLYDLTGGKLDWKAYLRATGGRILDGYQLRYIYFIDRRWRRRLTVPVLDYSEIDRVGAGMYKGQRMTLAERRGTDG